MKANLYFAIIPTTVDEQTIYTIGTYTLPNNRINIIFTDFQGTGRDIVLFVTTNQAHLEIAETLTEFIGHSYLDALARVAFGISNFTAGQIARLYWATWKQADDTYISGTAKQWEDAGELRPVKFTSGVTLLGQNIEE